MANQFTPSQPKHPHAAGDLSMPSAKRQRLSPPPSQYSNPLPSSPWGPPPAAAASPTVPYLSLPTPQTPAYAFHFPQPVQPPYQDALVRYTPGAMGPPERPAEKAKEQADKATDVNDLGDIVSASGIDLKEEENYLLATYRNRQNEFAAPNASFGVGTPSATASPHHSFKQWSQGSLGSQPAFQGTGPLSQPVSSQKSVEDELKEKHKQAARRFAEKKARHLEAPFLNVGNARNLIGWKSYQFQVRYTADGRSSAADPPKFFGVALQGAEGVGVVQARGSGVVSSGKPLEDILSLLSLATEQRLRDLLEDAVGVARSRRYGSHGVVPPDWASIATGNGPAESVMANPQSLTGTAWDQLPDSGVSLAAVGARNNQNHGPSDPNSPRLPTPPTSEPSPQPTIAFKAEVAPSVRGLGSGERHAEERRVAARKKREKEIQGSLESPATPGGPSTPGTPVASANAAQETKITKKERERLAKQVHQTDEAMRQQANQTAALALGGKPKYSWMTPSSASTAGSGFGTASGFGAGVGTGKVAVASKVASKVVAKAPAPKEEDRALRSKDGWKAMGNFREDGPGGKGVQLRDMVVVLERDGGLESCSLTKAISMMPAEKQVGK